MGQHRQKSCLFFFSVSELFGVHSPLSGMSERERKHTNEWDGGTGHGQGHTNHPHSKMIVPFLLLTPLTVPGAWQDKGQPVLPDQVLRRALRKEHFVFVKTQTQIVN